MPKSSDAARWLDPDKRNLVVFLHGIRAEIGEGGNWKKTSLNAAATHLQSLGAPAEGGIKSGDSVRTQWTAVRAACLFMMRKLMSWLFTAQEGVSGRAGHHQCIWSHLRRDEWRQHHHR